MTKKYKMSEKKLIKQLIANDQRAIRKFYQLYQERLLNFILKKIKDPKDAEEILQDTFLSTLDSLPIFKQNCSLYTYLCSIAKHEIADFYRRQKIKTFLFSHFPILENLASQALSPQRDLEEKELKREALRTLKNLSEGYSRILRLKYIDGLSYQEIAKKLKKSVKAVESKLARARQAFAKSWQSRLNPQGDSASSY